MYIYKIKASFLAPRWRRQDIFLSFGWKPVLIHRILIGFEVIKVEKEKKSKKDTENSEN